jgi:hypothetical protein
LRLKAAKVWFARLGMAIGDRLPEFNDASSVRLVDGSPWLEVRPSLISGAGDGLFVTRDIACGEFLCRYIGTRKNLLDVLRTRDRTYLLMRHLNCFLDCKPHPEVVGRYVNHHFDPHCRNVEFDELDGEIWYVATCDIRAGEELFVDYGSFYWQVLYGQHACGANKI